MKLKLLLLVCLICISFETLCKEKEFNIKEIVNKISNYNCYDYDKVGIEGIKTEQYERYEKLKKYASKDELLELLTNKNPVVVCYAFKALINKKNIDFTDIVLKLINDNRKFYSAEGCFLGNDNVNHFIFREAKGNLPVKTVQKIYSQIILRNIKNELIKIAYENILPEENLYKYIRNEVLNGSEFAIIGLSKYQKSQDKELILDSYKRSKLIFYEAVQNFPAKEFVLTIEKQYANIDVNTEITEIMLEQEEYVNAIASFHNEWAVNMLNRIYSKYNISNRKNMYIRFLVSSCDKYNKNGVFDKFIILGLKEEYIVNGIMLKKIYFRNKLEIEQALKKKYNKFEIFLLILRLNLFPNQKDEYEIKL